MKRTLRNWTLALVLFSSVGLGSQILRADEADVIPDHAKYYVEPFDEARHQLNFIQLAGDDFQLDADEFAAGIKKAGGFVKPFDDFKLVLKFDSDKNEKVDWLEAREYRKYVAKLVMAEFDADKNGKLEGEERDKANALLNEGKLPAEPEEGLKDTPKAEEKADGETDSIEELREKIRKEHDEDGDGKLSDEEYNKANRAFQQALRDLMIKKYDKDGDGELNREERRTAWRERAKEREKQMLKEYDKDGDGELSREERREARQSEMRKAWQRRYDRDGDGEISKEEQKEMDEAREAMRKQREEQQKRMLEQFDKNKNGQMDREEWEEARKQWRDRQRQQPQGDPMGEDGAVD